MGLAKRPQTMWTPLIGWDQGDETSTNRVLCIAERIRLRMRKSQRACASEKNWEWPGDFSKLSKTHAIWRR